MNKKISTMFASTLLMVGAVFGTADATIITLGYQLLKGRKVQLI